MCASVACVDALAFPGRACKLRPAMARTPMPPPDRDLTVHTIRNGILVLAVIATAPGVEIDPAELLDFLRPRLAHFMLPRYVRRLDDLPKTATHKVEKHRLRADGVTPDTWDREAAGVRVARETLDRRG